uniref:Zinc transporter ZIP4/12 EF-hand domain-containing protein n=1 Tax=Sinocyclocheilus rhinocerous TaxID=307959 RepID=A0A673LTM4_9TELE
METRGVLGLCFACLGVFTGARGDKKDIYVTMDYFLQVNGLTEDALLSLFERLENRVQCSGVSCGKPCLTMKDILEESSHQHGDHTHTELDSVMGNVLYHALRGDCMKAHDLHEQQYFVDYIFSHFDFEGLLKALNLGGGEHDHDAEKQHSRNSHSHGDAHRTNSSWDTVTLPCFSAEDLLRIHRLNSSSLSRNQFTQISPALIQQIPSGGCSEISPAPVSPDSLSTAERYGYATLANLLICLMAMFGIVVLLFSACTQVFELCIQFCVSLAVGCLTGDALLHLLPAFLGLHVHDHAEEKLDYVYKLLVLIAGIYFFYLMEGIFSIITRREHHHNHDEEESDVHHKVLQMFQLEKQNKHSSSQADLVDAEKREKSFLEPVSPKKEQCLLPYMITIGDGIHNFADSLAIGAAFSILWRSGLATSLAVLCHELPHELGDFAILLHCGLSVKRALLLHVASSLTSFIGLYIALSVSTETVAKEWISAVTAGLFLYVGLADMLIFLLQNLGLLSGWGILLLLSFYEDQIGL